MDWKKIGKRLIFPPIWLMIILTLFSAVALVVVFVKNLNNSPISYVVYVLSFYTLLVDCIFFGTVFPKRYKKVKKKIYSHPVGNRYMTDMAFRTHISLYLSLTINLLYVATNLFSGIYYRSVWFITLASYYIILVIMRFLLLRYVGKIGIGKDRIKALKRSRVCGIILLPLNIVLYGVVILVIVQGKGFQYNGIFIYVMAMYTFYVTTRAIVNIIRYRKYNSPIMSTTKVISLTASLVSMLSLETAMLSQFGKDMTAENKQLMIILTGAGVSVIVITMALSMIIKTTKEINKRGNSNGK